MHQTSGSGGTPLRWLDTPESWEWFKRCWQVIYSAAGFRAEDRFAFPFSFGPFIGFWAAFEAAAALGRLCLPAGGMTTRARLRYILENEATVVCCTPTYALHMAEVAAEEGMDIAHSAVRALLVAGEPGGSIPATRAKIESAWGARIFDHPGLTEVGPWGFECLEAPGGVHVIETEFIPEVIDPVTTGPVRAGEIGELVLTNLGRHGSPLIRYRTGDQVRMTRGRCACGRHFARMEGGVLGRTDDVLWVRGNNVFPSAVEAVLREFDAVAEFRIRVDGSGPMTELCLDVEPVTPAAASGLDGRIVNAVRDRLGFSPRVTLVPPGALPRFEMKAKRLVK
jgi:phenylacetate-CoA ligase